MSFTSYRSLATQEAVQYLGEPIPGVTCDGNKEKYGCDSSRAHLPHVHTAATGGITVLAYGDFVSPQAGGPFVAVHDSVFRSYFEVKGNTPVDPAIAKAKAEHDHPVVGKQAAAPTHEERTYADGTTASGTGPLPDFSPSGGATLTVKQVPATPIDAHTAPKPQGVPDVRVSAGDPGVQPVPVPDTHADPVIPPSKLSPGVPNANAAAPDVHGAKPVVPPVAPKPTPAPAPGVPKPVAAPLPAAPALKK